MRQTLDEKRKFKRDLKEAFKRHAFFPRTKITYTVLRKVRGLKDKQTPGGNWAQWLAYVSRDVNLEPTLLERVQEGTKTLLPMWMRNYTLNLANVVWGDDAEVKIPEDYVQSTLAALANRTPLVESDPDFPKDEAPIVEYKNRKIKHPPEGSAIVVGRGPSLFRHKHCELLREYIENGYKGTVVATDGGLIPLLDAGVIPDIVVSVDGAPIIKKWFDHPLVDKWGPEMKWVASVTVNHDVYKLVKSKGMKTYWFQPIFDDYRQNESWTRLQVLMTQTEKYPNGVPRAQSGGNAGAFAWILAKSVLKRSPIALIGMDLGYPEGTPLEETHYFSGVMKAAGGDVAAIRDAYQKFYHPVFKEHAYVDLVFFHYRAAFLELQYTNEEWYRLYGGTHNCTEGGTLWGHGITCMSFKDFLSKYKK